MLDNYNMNYNNYYLQLKCTQVEITVIIIKLD